MAEQTIDKLERAFPHGDRRYLAMSPSPRDRRRRPRILPGRLAPIIADRARPSGSSRRTRSRWPRPSVATSPGAAGRPPIPERAQRNLIERDLLMGKHVRETAREARICGLRGGWLSWSHPGASRCRGISWSTAQSVMRQTTALATVTATCGGFDESCSCSIRTATPNERTLAKGRISPAGAVSRPSSRLAALGIVDNAAKEGSSPPRSARVIRELDRKTLSCKRHCRIAGRNVAQSIRLLNMRENRSFGAKQPRGSPESPRMWPLLQDRMLGRNTPLTGERIEFDHAHREDGEIDTSHPFGRVPAKRFVRHEQNATV